MGIREASTISESQRGVHRGAENTSYNASFGTVHADDADADTDAAAANDDDDDDYE